MYFKIGSFYAFFPVDMFTQIRRFCWMSNNLREINFVQFTTSRCKDNKNVYFEFTAHRESDRAMAAEVRAGEGNVWEGDPQSTQWDRRCSKILGGTYNGGNDSKTVWQCEKYFHFIPAAGTQRSNSICIWGLIILTTATINLNCRIKRIPAGIAQQAQSLSYFAFSVWLSDLLRHVSPIGKLG